MVAHIPTPVPGDPVTVWLLPVLYAYGADIHVGRHMCLVALGGQSFQVVAHLTWVLLISYYSVNLKT